VNGSKITELIAAHPWVIESDYRMCTDGFDREFWRGRCTACESTGRWRFWRSHAEEDRYEHFVDADEKRLDSPE
jgi:hypothetical protein